MIQKLLEYPIYGFNIARFLNYKTQSVVINALVTRLPLVKKDLVRMAAQTSPQEEKFLFRELHELLRQDAKNIADGIYPIQVLFPETPVKHLTRIPLLLLDGLRIYKKRLGRRHDIFSSSATEHLDEVPEYFKRNYHFQTDGYLSEASARLYDHQVELLFTGAADAMRRILLKPLKERLGQAENLKFLEIACGTGRMTRFMKLTFPKAKIIATDLSRPYVSVAREKCADLPRVDFMQADSAQLPFKDNSFDVLYSVFLFHELPPDVRANVIQEAYRVLKPGGLFAMVDSVQLEDMEEGRQALLQFPVYFHEPFYRNYIENPIEGLLKEKNFQFIKVTKGFLSKAVIGQKPLA